MKEHLRTAIWRDIIISLRKRRFNSADGDKEEKNMTVKECYEQMGADYEGVLGRLRSEVLIKKFAKKFLDDGSFRSLKDNLVQKNGVKYCFLFVSHLLTLSYTFFYSIRLISIPNSCMSQCLIYVYF